MLTAEELAVVPIFSSLDAGALRELIRGSADMHLGPGEHAVHEGDEPMLLVVLSGKLEVLKRVDGIERKIGERLPGTFHGEVPIIYGTQFQAGARAMEPARLARIDARQFQAAAALAPELARRMGELARERIGGLQGIAANARRAKVIILGQRWDPACLEVRRFLASNQIAFDGYTPDAPELAERWHGEVPVELPALQVVDGATLVRPRLRQLAELLGLDTAPKASTYDTVIIGGGPAGLAAAVYGASEGLRTVVIEREAPGGQAGTSSRIENYLGFPAGISGDELASRALRQAKRLGAEVLITRRIEHVDPVARTVELDGGEVLTARTIILATGVSWRRVAIEGVDQLMGKGIYYGAARSEASTTQGLDIHLIGAGNSAGQAAMFFANHAQTVTLVVRGDAIEKSMSQYLVDQIRTKSNIKVALQTEVQAVHGEDHLTAVDLIDRATGEVRREESGGLFVFIGADAETDWLPAEVARDGRGYVLTGEDLKRAGRWSESRDPYLLETSVPGVFACGDVRFSPVKRVAAAVGEGSMAIAFVHQYLARVAAGER
ncbi:MAG: pyridine nucleotide-disulfide oxidoreductase [Devosia sp.]|uniref:FAD-dependent oxidoreductase n=1 Tax=Devosia sp. TaxID=1871048 RepID=UPI00260FC5BE|nr:cyclic nucleotide-binding domain-containing thioredoxin-disulfide reductase [Devosia sp.]MDB5542163.1 pyridine nucleotide-disulfide oxidoreductase [Devosia sp.]